MLESDPSAKAVKKKSRILAGDISKFMADAEAKSGTIEAQVFNQDFAKFIEETNVERKAIYAGIANTETHVAHDNYWISIYGDFKIKFYDRIISIREQISELGYETPRIDFLVTNQLTQSNVREEFCRPAIDSAAMELQELSEQIKDTQ